MAATGASLALAAVAGGQQLRVAGAQADAATERQVLADYRLEIAERDRRNAARDRVEEQRRQQVADEEGRNADREKEALQGLVAAAESAAGGMRGDARLRAGHRATCDTIAAQQRQAGASAVVVLGGLLEDADRMAGSLAEALSRSRIAGQGCEAIADRARPPSR